MCGKPFDVVWVKMEKATSSMYKEKCMIMFTPARLEKIKPAHTHTQLISDRFGMLYISMKRTENSTEIGFSNKILTKTEIKNKVNLNSNI